MCVYNVTVTKAVRSGTTSRRRRIIFLAEIDDDDVCPRRDIRILTGNRRTGENGRVAFFFFLYIYY